MGRGNFEGKRGAPWDTLRSSVQKRPNRSRCRLDCGLGWAVGIMWLYDMGPEVLRDVAMATNFETKIAIDWLYVDDSD